MELIVGTFNTPQLFLFQFERPTVLTPVRAQPAIGNHSWLALSSRNSNIGRRLYATTWTDPPSIAAYSVDDTRDIKLINTKPVRARPGYVCVSPSHIYSVGGPTGEVFRLRSDGGIGELVQALSFVADSEASTATSAVPHGDFGGLRHGSHSVDLSADGKSLYVADIGRNAIFTYSVSDLDTGEHLTLGAKHVSPRPDDGPRHTWPHPNGKILYALQEHTSMVDIFSISANGMSLVHIDGVKIIPQHCDAAEFWADEVRISRTSSDQSRYPRYLYASTRGLHKETKGYVAVFRLRHDGTLATAEPICIWQTPTSGGIANAIEPAPAPILPGSQDIEYLALTDSEEGNVSILGFDGQQISEMARYNLGQTADGQVIQAATAVWL